MTDELTLEQLAWAHDQASEMKEILEGTGAISLGVWTVDENDELVEVLSGTGPNGEPVGRYRD